MSDGREEREEQKTRIDEQEPDIRDDGIARDYADDAWDPEWVDS
jgi:hypothetical protein